MMTGFKEGLNAGGKLKSISHNSWIHKQNVRVRQVLLAEMGI